MKPELKFNLKRTAIALLLLAAWFTMSNHCGLLVLAQGKTSAQSKELHKCCSRNLPEDGKQTPKKSDNACCKSLRVVPSDAPAKFVKVQDVFLSTDLFGSFSVESLSVEEPECPVSFDTGPPGSKSFAETVLQRSLLSHAPPFAG